MTDHEPTGDEPDFEMLLDFLKETRGFDFTGYKRSSLRRRVDRRMQQLGVDRDRGLRRPPAGATRTSSPGCSTRS